MSTPEGPAVSPADALHARKDELLKERQGLLANHQRLQQQAQALHARIMANAGALDELDRLAVTLGVTKAPADSGDEAPLKVVVDNEGEVRVEEPPAE